MAGAPKSANEAVAQVGRFLRELSLQQQLLIGGGSLVVGVVLFIFVRMMNQPEMKILAQGLKATEAQALAAKLGAKKIGYEVSPDGGTITVPAEKLAESRMEFASQPGNGGGRLGFELFDKANWVASDFDEKVNYQRAMEGELERTLQSLSGVDAVRVHLVLPRDSVFTEKERSAKATVVIKLRGRNFSRDLQGSIAKLMAGSVDKLDPEKVTVVDADTGQAFVVARDGAAVGGESLEETLQARLIQTLEPIVGADRIRASVRVEYEMNSNEETQEIYDPNAAVAISTHKTEEQGRGSIGGVAGATANVVGASEKASRPGIVAGTRNETPVSRSENNTFAVSRRVKHSTQPAGGVKRIAAAVLVDDAIIAKQESGKLTTERQKRTPEQLQTIEQVAKAAIGVDTNRGDVLTVANLAFDQQPVEQPKSMALLDRSRRVLNDWAWLLRIAGIFAIFIVVYLMVLRPIKKQIITSLSLPGKTASAGHGGAQHLTMPDQVLVTPNQPEETRKLSSLTKQLATKVAAEPALSTKLVQNWIGEAD
jgi:flagellar M-ring protein FliF